MSNSAEFLRREYVKRGGGLRRHSMNQHITKMERQGDIRVHGASIVERRREDRKQSRRLQAMNDVYESVEKLFDGQGTEADALRVVLLIGEFESTPRVMVSKNSGTIYQASTVDFTKLHPDGR